MFCHIRVDVIQSGCSSQQKNIHLIISTLNIFLHLTLFILGTIYFIFLVTAQHSVLHLMSLETKLNIFLTLCVIAGDSATQVMRKDEPVFISQSEAFKFAVGDTITLPCEVTQPGKLDVAPYSNV